MKGKCRNLSPGRPGDLTGYLQISKATLGGHVVNTVEEGLQDILRDELFSRLKAYSTLDTTCKGQTLSRPGRTGPSDPRHPFMCPGWRNTEVPAPGPQVLTTSSTS